MPCAHANCWGHRPDCAECAVERMSEALRLIAKGEERIPSGTTGRTVARQIKRADMMAMAAKALKE